MPDWLDFIGLIMSLLIGAAFVVWRWWRFFGPVYFFLYHVYRNLRWSYLYLRCHEYNNAVYALWYGAAIRSIATIDSVDESDIGPEEAAYKIPITWRGSVVALVDPITVDAVLSNPPIATMTKEETEEESLRRAFRPGLSMREVAKRANRPGINKDNVRSKLEKYGIV